MDNNVIWDNAKQGDSAAFKELFDLYYRPLCYYALQFTKNMTEAEDVVQEIFVKLWAKKDAIEIKTSVKAYMYQSVYNACVDQSRRKKLKEGFLDTLKKEALSSQIEEDESLLREKISEIKTLVDTLPPRCKEVLLLNKHEGFKHREIAEKLEISIKTVERHLDTAFKKIRKGFNDKGLFLILIKKVFKHC